MTARGWSIVGISCALISLHAASSAADKPVAQMEAQPVRVDRYLYPVRILPTHDAAAGECDDLSPSDLLVTARHGSVTKVESLDRIRLQTRHAVLIDNSHSMDLYGRLDSAKRIAQQYVRELRGESAFVFSGHEETFLVQPSTDDPERAAAAIASIQSGYNTLLWNSIFIALNQLSLQPEPQKVLTVITDAGFFPSLQSQSDVLQLLKEDPSLGLFVIVLAADGQAAIEIKKAVAISSGEMFFMDGSARDKDVDRALERIRAWTRRRGILSVALSADSESVRPEVKAKAISAHCTIRVEELSEPQRRPLGSVRPVDSLLPLPPLQAWYDAYGHQPKKPSDEICRGGGWFVRVGKDRLVGCVLDVSAQESMLYDPDTESKLLYFPHVALKTKSFLSFVPPLGSWPTGPFNLLDQISRFSVVEAVDLIPPVFHPLLVDGETFLAEQPWIAYALLQYPSYREWAVGRLREDLSRQLNALKQEFRSKLPAATPDRPEEEIQELAERAALSSPEGHRMDLRSRNPESRDLQGYVSSWLGDVSAQSLFLDWEQKWIRAYLADPSPDFVAKARERWARARRWLALPQRNRVVTPLILTYDPTGRRLGYWRVVLPQPSFLGIRATAARIGLRDLWERMGPRALEQVPYDLIPRDPVGLLAIERLAKKRKLPAGDYDVTVHYAVASPNKTPVRWFTGGDEPERPYDSGRVEVTMKPAGNEPSVLKARFHYDPKRPDPVIRDATDE